MSQFPDIAKHYSIWKNGNQPDEWFASSGKKVWWTCSKGHYYYSSSNARTKRPINSCPICSGEKLLRGYNDFATWHPELVTWWDWQRNTKKPWDIRHGSGYKAWWICEKCGLSYQSAVNIHVRGHGCPYCTGRKIKPGVNDLATLYPDIASEFSSRNTTQAKDISPHTHKKYWWTCPKCGQEYRASANNRTIPNGATACPFCASSSGAQSVERILRYYHIEYESEKTFKGLRDKYPLRYDFVIYAHHDKQHRNPLYAIEFDGEQHFRPVETFGGKKAFDLQNKHMAMKINYALTHGFAVANIAYKGPAGFEPLQQVQHLLFNLKLIDGYRKHFIDGTYHMINHDNVEQLNQLHGGI